MRGEDAGLRRRALLGSWLAIVGSAAALAVTLAPAGETAPPGQGLGHPALDLRDFILNLGLLAPVGAGLSLRRWRLGAILGCALALSAGIELLQLLLPIGRDASLLDIVANTAGAGIAAWVVPRASRGLLARVREARWLAATALLAWVAQGVMTAWALQRDIPVAPQYYGQWAHVLRGMVPLAGTVTAFSIQDRAIPDDAVPETAALRAALADGDTVTLRVVATDLRRSFGRSQVAAVTNGAGELVAGFERDGCLIRFRLRTRGERVGLRSQGVRLPTSCGRVSGVTVITGRAARASLAITTMSQAEERHATLALAPSLGWRLLAPVRWQGGGWDVLGSMLWVAVWGAPLALWLRAAYPRHVAGSALLYAAGLLGGPALVAAASGLAVGTPADVLGAALGWWLGGPALRRLRPFFTETAPEV